MQLDRNSLNDQYSAEGVEKQIKDIPTMDKKKNYSLEELEDTVSSILAALPRVDRDALRREMGDMIVSLKKDPTTGAINEGLALAQAYKDRMTEIYKIAMRECNVRSKMVEMLFDAYMKVSAASSADKRKGEATLRYMSEVIKLESAKIFFDEVDRHFRNIASANENISRQVTVMQIQLATGERRKEHNYNSDAEEFSRKSARANKETSWDDFE